MPRYDIVIRNGTIVDGDRTPRYTGDVAVKDAAHQKIFDTPRLRNFLKIFCHGYVPRDLITLIISSTILQ